MLEKHVSQTHYLLLCALDDLRVEDAVKLGTGSKTTHLPAKAVSPEHLAKIKPNAFVDSIFRG